MRFMRWGVMAVVLLLTGLLGPTRVAAEATRCQKQVLGRLLAYEKAFVKTAAKCFDLQNALKITGPCRDSARQAKLDRVRGKVAAKIAARCSLDDAASLGFPSSCADYGSAESAAGAQCAALPLTTSAELAACLQCWKAAELSSYVATLYASHALEACDGSLDDASPTCVPLACTSPLPEQRNLGNDGKNTVCQKAIGKAGGAYLAARAKALGRCGLKGGGGSGCLEVSSVQRKLVRAETRARKVVARKCGKRNPEPSPAFCCRTQGSACLAAATPEECSELGGDPQEGRFCDGDLRCRSLGGDKHFLWWGTCPDRVDCAGPALASTDHLVDCVAGMANHVVDRLLCLQIPRSGAGAWPCPAAASASGAFLD